MYKRVHVIINPGAGKNDPILNVLNAVFHKADIDWNVSITKHDGDGTQSTHEAIQAGVDALVVYGGDGTIREVGGALKGSGIPLAILPGGTANFFAASLAIPREIRKAAQLLGGEHRLRAVDIGMVDGEPFLVALTTGVLSNVMQGASREMKGRLGFPAYLLSAFREFRNPDQAEYHITVDGQENAYSGIACMISTLGPLVVDTAFNRSNIPAADGQLDVVLFHRADLKTWLVVAGDSVGLDRLDTALPHWLGKRIIIDSDPPQLVALDGDVVGSTPVEVEIFAQALQIIVPLPRQPQVTKKPA